MFDAVWDRVMKPLNSTMLRDEVIDTFIAVDGVCCGIQATWRADGFKDRLGRRDCFGVACSIGPCSIGPCANYQFIKTGVVI